MLDDAGPGSGDNVPSVQFGSFRPSNCCTVTNYSAAFDAAAYGLSADHTDYTCLNSAESEHDGQFERCCKQYPAAVVRYSRDFGSDDDSVLASIDRLSVAGRFAADESQSAVPGSVGDPAADGTVRHAVVGSAAALAAGSAVAAYYPVFDDALVAAGSVADAAPAAAASVADAGPAVAASAAGEYCPGSAAAAGPAASEPAAGLAGHAVGSANCLVAQSFVRLVYLCRDYAGHLHRQP